MKIISAQTAPKTALFRLAIIKIAKCILLLKPQLHNGHANGKFTVASSNRAFQAAVPILFPTSSFPFSSIFLFLSTHPFIVVIIAGLAPHLRITYVAQDSIIKCYSWEQVKI